MVVIQESGMRFGEYPEEQVFRLEKSIPYTKNLMSNGIKSCEFILRRESKLYFIEAKSSCPNQIKADTPEEKKKNYNAYVRFKNYIGIGSKKCEERMACSIPGCIQT